MRIDQYKLLGQGASHNPKNQSKLERNKRGKTRARETARNRNGARYFSQSQDPTHSTHLLCFIFTMTSFTTKKWPDCEGYPKIIS